MSDFSTSTTGKDLAKIGTGLSKAGKSADQDAKKPYSDESTSYHTGGTIPEDGKYNLQKGEHVLTAEEAAKVKKHALLMVGLKSLANPTKTKSPKKKAAPVKSEKEKE